MTSDERPAAGIGPWLRLALIPVAVLLLVLGVWLLPMLTSLGVIEAALIGIAWLAILIAALRRLSLPIPEGERRRVESELFIDGAGRPEWLSRFVTLLTLSTVIAALGLLADSTAVVIGAMVVAPLMAPLMTLAGALTLTRPARIAESVVIVAAGSLLAIATAVAVSWVVPGTAPTGELLARTQPQLTDLGIALAAGAAGAYVTVRPHALGALPGVAIAVALIPPLATVGVMLETGDGHRAKQALILFLTNLVAIVLSAAIVFLIAGLTPSAAEIRSRRRLQLGFGIAVTATIAIMVPLAHNSIVLLETDEDVAAIRAVLAPPLDDQGATLESVAVDDTADEIRVTVEVVGPRRPESAELARTVADELGEPVALELRWRFGERATAS
ncbi:MAG: DUF389 domain-containing protein [Gaiellaceae bacterium]